MGRRNEIIAPRYRRVLEGVGEMGSVRHDDNYRRVLVWVGEMGSVRHDIGECSRG